MKNKWNVELLKTGEGVYTLYFLKYDDLYSKVINEKDELYSLCDNLHKNDKTYWQTEELSLDEIKDINNIKEMLKSKI